MSNEVLTKVGNKAEWAAGGAGGGSLEVIFTTDTDTRVISCSKTYNEIKAAYDANKPMSIVAVDYQEGSKILMFGACVAMLEDVFWFYVTTFNGVSSSPIKMAADGTISA